MSALLQHWYMVLADSQFGERLTIRTLGKLSENEGGNFSCYWGGEAQYFYLAAVEADPGSQILHGWNHLIYRKCFPESWIRDNDFFPSATD